MLQPENQQCLIPISSKSNQFSLGLGELCLKFPVLCYAGNSWKGNYYASTLRCIMLTLCSCNGT